MKKFWFVLCLMATFGAQALANSPPPPAKPMPPGQGSYRPMTRQECQDAANMAYLCQQWGECCRYVRKSPPRRCQPAQGICTKNADCCSGVCMPPPEGYPDGLSSCAY